MKVRDLIQQLQSLPQDIEVFVANEDRDRPLREDDLRRRAQVSYAAVDKSSPAIFLVIETWS